MKAPLLACYALAACSSSDELPRMPGWDLGGAFRSLHQGPLVSHGHTATRRFVDPMLEAYDRAAPFELAEGAEGMPPASALKAIVDRSIAELQAVEFGAFEALGLEIIAADAPPRTVVATLVGSKFPDQVVVVRTRVDGLSASADAHAIGVVLEAARAVKRAVASRAIERPLRTLAFVIDEGPRAAHTFEDRGQQVIASLSIEGGGLFEAPTTEVPLFERSPDPGMRGGPSGPREASAVPEVRPNALAIVARMAIVDVGLAAGPWPTGERPFGEALSRDPFVARGIPAVHFARGGATRPIPVATEDEELDRSREAELGRTAVALVVTGLAVADAQVVDMKRYLDSLTLERRLRRGEAGEADPAAAEWDAWFEDGRHWLRCLCNGIPYSVPPRPDDGG